MLAIRRSRLRIWRNTAFICAPIPRSSHLGSSAHVANHGKFSFNFIPSLSSRGSSSSRSAVKVAGYNPRHAEITAYVDRLKSEDVQVQLPFTFSVAFAYLTATQLLLHALWLRRKALPPPDYDSSASISQEAATRFALADLDGDGKLSKHEFESE
jgi:hypothetical protein